ncbi:MAG: hypothetical protein WC637_22935, partial [Victivallales bacterium]
MGTIKLKECIEEIALRAGTLDNFKKMKVYGVSNKEGITTTDHKKSEDTSKYLYVSDECFAYNPYRINVGSIGLVPKGAQGLVSPAYVVFKTKKEKLVSDLLLDFLKSKEGLFQIGKYARGTVRKALRYDDLGEIEIPDIPIEKQLILIKKKKELNHRIIPLQTELSSQQKYLSKLRQSI